jgi:hypothetical protein
MQPIYIVLTSAAVTGGIVIGIYYLTRSSKNQSPQQPQPERGIEDLYLGLDEELLEELEEGIVSEEEKREKVLENTNSPKKYPDCFGSKKKFKTCEKDCGVSKECNSTIEVLEGF